MSELDRSLYTVAWIAPLEIEALAALHMLDERHRGRFPRSEGDKHVFHGGMMCGHHVVIATIPPGNSYGTVSAATLASEVRRSFPNLCFGLLVGVAAGIPDLSKSPPRDIRLGDVLVALPEGDTPAVVAYDLGKETVEGGFQLLHSGHTLRSTDTLVRSAIGSLKLNAPNEPDLFLTHWREMRLKQHSRGTFIDPGQHRDRLYQFSSTGQKRVSRRQTRPEHSRTRVWYGPIGSGNKLMKNSRLRDQLRDKYNVIGLEMEAAGVMESIPVGVIRGVSDYADDHKNKEWQPYASAIAAAYGKAVLREIFPRTTVSVISNILPDDTTDSSQALSKGFGTTGLDGNLKKRGYVAEVPDQITGSEHRVPESRRVCYRSISKNWLAEASPSPFTDNASYGSKSNLDLQEFDSQWPEYQTERPTLSARFVERHSIPASLLPDSETWRTSERQSPYIVVIYGLSGVGKSQICLKAITQHQQRFRGIFYIDASNPATGSSNYLDISRICNIQSHEEGIKLEERIRIIRSWLANQKDPWLLMIDGANSSDSGLQDYIPGVGYGTILITTTDENVAMCGHTFSKLDIMDERGAVDLLMRYKRPDTVLSSEEHEAARTLAVKILGCLPLAIAQAGSYILNRFCTYKEYSREFEASPEIALRFKPLPTPLWGAQKSVWGTFNLSLNCIEESSQSGAAEAFELLRTLSFLHHERIPLRLFEKAWCNLKDVPTFSQFLPFLDPKGIRWDTSDLRAAFDILRRYSLLNFASPGAQQFSMHKLIHTICRESLSKEQQYKYAFRAASLIAMALAGIKAPLSWIDNPSDFELQTCLMSHIKFCTADGMDIILRRRDLRDWRIEARILVLFAKAYAATGHFKDALNLLVMAYASGDNDLQARSNVAIAATGGDPTALQVMELLAVCDTHFGKHDDALSLRRQIVSLQTANPSYGIADHCVAMMNMADSFWAVGEHDDALERSKQVLRLRREALKPDDPKLLRTRRKVAEFLHGSDLRLKALKLRERILRHATARSHQSDIERLDLLASQNALADSYQWDGQLLKALDIRRIVYSWRCNILGSEHPDTLLAHDRLIGTKSSLSDKVGQQDICSMREESVNTWTRILGDLHPHTLEAKVNLGHSYSATGQLDKAIAVQEAVLEARREHFNQHKNSSAVLNLLSSMGNVANLMTKSKRFEDALDARKSALTIAEEHLGQDSRVTFKIHNNLVTCLASQANETTAKQDVLAARLAILKKQKEFLGNRDVSIMKTMSLLAVDLADSDIEQSIRIRRKLLKKQQGGLGRENRETLDNMKKLAISLAIKASCSNGNFEESTALMQTVENVQTRLLGKTHEQTCDTTIELLCLYTISGEHDEAHSLEKTLNALDVASQDSGEVSDDPDKDGLSGLECAIFELELRHSWKVSKQRKMRRYEQLELPKLELPEYIFKSSSDKYSGESGSERSDAE